METSRDLVYSQTLSTPVVYTLLTWSLGNLLLSLAGNTLVLVSSIKYSAIKLDEVSVALIQHISIADAAYLIFRAGLGIPGLITRQWHLGQGMCDVSTFLTYTLAATSVHLICILNINKLLALKYPLKSILRQRRTGHILAACVWIVIIATVAITWWLTDWSCHFRSNILNCLESAQRERLKQVIFAIYIIGPMFVIVITTVLLMRLVHTARGLRVKGIITLISVSVVLLVAWLPYGIYNGVMAFLSDETIRRNVHTCAIVDTISVYLLYANYSCNPLIYYRSVKSFNKFVKEAVFQRVQSTRFSWKSSHRNNTGVTLRQPKEAVFK